MPNHIDENIKKERARTLIALSKKLELTYMHKYLNQKVIVLTENYKDGYTYGHTSNYLFIKILGKIKANEEVTVLITSIDYPYLIGQKI